MTEHIKTRLLGKLRIYLFTGERVKTGRLFSRAVYRHIIEQAQKDGLLHASAYNTHLGYHAGSEVQQHSLESSNQKLTICVELIDTKENLQTFFNKHRDMLKGKVVIYKEVEYWETAH